MDFGDWQCRVSHSVKSFTLIYLISFYFLTLYFPHCIFFNMPHFHSPQSAKWVHSDTMSPIVTIGFSHCFIGPIRGPMLLSCWRNVIRPRPTVNIHISGPQRNTRRSCFATSAHFICIGRRTKAVTVGCEQRGMRQCHFRAKEMEE